MALIKTVMHLLILIILFSYAHSKIGFIKDQNMDAQFPPAITRIDDDIPEGHLRPLGMTSVNS